MWSLFIFVVIFLLLNISLLISFIVFVKVNKSCNISLFRELLRRLMEENEGEEGENMSVEAEGVPAGGGGDAEAEDDEEEHFDISLPATHSYMGGRLVNLRGRAVLEAGWVGGVPCLAHHGAVFPGETVPMVLAHAHDVSHLTRAIDNDKLFGLLCPDETGTLVSGYGVLCEVFEAAVGDAQPAVTFKARAIHRFRFKDMPKQAVPLHDYARMKIVEVVVLPELLPPDPLRAARLHSLDPHRRPGSALDRRLRSLDAVATGWPLFVYDMFDYTRMRTLIHNYFKSMQLDKLPSEPVSLSFWVARNLALPARDRLALFAVDNALLRLHMEVRDIRRKSVLCCSSCATEIARRDYIIPMSSEGVHSNYTNLGGYMHDIMTVSRVTSVELTGSPSDEYSWFPGYTWTIAVCAGCMAHVGWRFDAVKKSLRPQQFFALCRNYVTPRAVDAEPLPPLVPYLLHDTQSRHVHDEL